MQNNHGNDGAWPEELDALTAAPQHHKLLFENNFVRVIDACIPAGEITNLHTHKWPATLHFISWSNFIRYDAAGNILLDSRNISAPPSNGTTLWSESLTPHALKNTGSEDLHVICVEIKTNESIHQMKAGKRKYMNGEKNLKALLQQLDPKLNKGEFIFCHVNDEQPFNLQNVLGSFREEEGLTVIIPKQLADERQLNYSFVASWITIAVHSSLEAVGLTAAFSTALTDAGISCNVIAAFYHDHIFVNSKDANKAMEVLKQLSKSTD